MSIADTIHRSVSPPGANFSDPALTIEGEGETRDCFAVQELAAQSIAAASKALAVYADQPGVTVNRRLASLWFGKSFRPLNWSMPKLRDEFSADYQTRDGWIRLHCNAKTHRQAVLTVLGEPKNHAEAAEIVSGWPALELQEAVVEAGGAAAMMYSADQWTEHPQGKMVTQEPFVIWHSVGASKKSRSVDSQRPLRGLKVLDLTRILAGPVATRFLAGYGASVLRIDPPGWDEVGNIPEMTPGKRCATLDLKSSNGKRALTRLISEADLLVHGYRADALERLGLGDEERHRLNPDLIDVSLNAFGWSGPWRNRRGFDSLVQMSCGIAETGMLVAKADKPHPLTVQALDHATGYCLAACILNALNHQRTYGEVVSARLSLARTAELLKTTQSEQFGAGFAEETDQDRQSKVEETDWGPAQRLHFPMTVGNLKASWDSPATPLHTSPPVFA